jgi:RHS repeat-associated protein
MISKEVIGAQEVGGGQIVANIYTADDERLWRYEITRNVSHWTVRDLGGKVLREFLDDPADDNGADWKLSREYVYRDGQLLAVNTSTGTEHYSLDHLGSPRLITDGAGYKVFQHHYLPFGREWTIGNDPVDGSKLRFTSHERDVDPASEPNGTLDYMHARFYNASMGRFLSVDPALDTKKALKEPQRWNRYSYVLNRPMTLTDPTGRMVQVPTNCASNIPCKEIRDLRNGLPPELRLFVRAEKLGDGRVVVNERLIRSVGRTDSGNFELLRGVVTSRNQVYVTSSSKYALLLTESGKPEVVRFAPLNPLTANTLGGTLPSQYSDEPVSYVHVNPFLGALSSASTMAHELYGHAYPCMHGIPCEHSQLPPDYFDLIEAEAVENFWRKP